MAIGGLAAQPAVCSVIAGAMSPEQVRANAAAGAWEPTERARRACDATCGRHSCPDQWQAVAPRWERGARSSGSRPPRSSEWLVGRLEPRPGETILELAAGTGETGFLLAPLLGPDGASDLERPLGRRWSRPRVASPAERGIEGVDFRVLDTVRRSICRRDVDGVLCRFGYILKAIPPGARARSGACCAPAAGSRSPSGRSASGTPG